MLRIDTKRFQKDFKAKEKEIFNKILFVIRKVAFDGFKNILVGSPVDTGLFRSSWIVSINKTPTGLPTDIVTNRDEIGALQVSMQRLGELKNFNLGQIIKFINNTSYGIYIEYGSPRRAATALIRINTDRMRSELERAIRAL